MIDDFIERKWGRRAVEYMFPELEPILKETLGVIVYQEQVMQISSVIGGYSLGGADLLRRAMGKKIAEEMAKQRDLFMKGAVEKKFPKDKSGQLFDLMEQFAGYGFNKSHSAAYALLAYHTAWLQDALPGRVHGRAAHQRNVEARKRREVHRRRVRRDEHPCRSAQRADVGMRTSRPSVRNREAPSASGLAAIKNVGHNAILSIIEARAALQ